jgi:peptidoglycan/xylan/chitin deacetylase (PgdA/CDA1 family)
MRLVKFKREKSYPFKLKRKIVPPLLYDVLTFSLLFIITTYLLLYITAPKIPILGFHGIVDLDNPTVGIIQTPVAQRMAYPEQNLETVLEQLVQKNYWFLSTQDLYDFFITKSKDIPPQHIGQKPIMLSFDDSYKTVYTNLLPALEKLKRRYGQTIKVVLFVNPGTLATPNHPSTTYLSCEELRTGYEKGFYDIQSHGLNHKNLTQINSQDLVTELAQAQTQLRACLAGLAPTETIAAHIAYPYGAFNRQVEAYAAKYYQSGFLYNSRALRFCWLDNPYLISRLTVNRDKPISQLIQMAAHSFVIKQKQPC